MNRLLLNVAAKLGRTSKRRPARVRSRRTLLGIETLEGRALPSTTLLDAVASTPAALTAPASPSGQGAAFAPMTASSAAVESRLEEPLMPYQSVIHVTSTSGFPSQPGFSIQI